MTDPIPPSISAIRDRWSGIPTTPPALSDRKSEDGHTYYDCPLCDREGTIDAELVETYDHNEAAWGIQSFGIGNEHIKFGNAVPHAVGDIVALLAEIEKRDGLIDELRTINARMAAELEQRDLHAETIAKAIPSLLELLKRDHSGNYCEMTAKSIDGVDVVITYQRMDRKTPHQLRVEAEAERDQLRAELAKARELLDATQFAMSESRNAGASAPELVRVVLPPLQYLKDRTIGDYTFSDRAEGFDDGVDACVEAFRVAGVQFEIRKGADRG